MARRFVLSGLRTQLAIAITAVAAFTLALTFFAVYRATGADLRHQIDSELVAQIGEWRQSVTARDLQSPAGLAAAAHRFIANQRYHPESRILVVDVVGGRTVTNDQAIVDKERARERLAGHASAGGTSTVEAHEGNGDGLLDARPGLATVKAEEVGSLRVDTYPIRTGGRVVGTLRIADPLSSFGQAQQRLQRIFLFVGSLALALALVVALLMAVLITRPLRRITAVAADVDAGELTRRVEMKAQSGEIAALGRTFDGMLDRLQRAFGRQRQFVSDASHELRTPLTVMRAQVELLDRETGDPARREELATLLRGLDTMDRLVDDMLLLANAEGGRLLEPRQIDLKLFLDDMARDLPLFGEREYRVERLEGKLYADPDRLTQVLRNVIRNAVNHTSPGESVTLTARARRDRIEFAVTDTGPGIPPEQLEQIFERFHRTDESRRRDRGGSGLGLPIARALVEAHGGRIWAESRPGEGATIRIELPGYEPPAQRPDPGPTAPRREPAGPRA
jgi:signal transduction histidine kinase